MCRRTMIKSEPATAGQAYMLRVVPLAALLLARGAASASNCSLSGTTEAQCEDLLSYMSKRDSATTAAECIAECCPSQPQPAASS